jgi:transposase InsO family protein
MLALQYKIVYKKGSENTAVDALSRHPQPSNSLCAISSVQATWLHDIVAGYQSDMVAQDKMSQLSIHSDSTGAYTLRDGVIRHRGRIWLGTNKQMHTQVADALHASPTGGHSGFPVTYRRVKSLFSWPLMKQFVHQHVQECHTCQRAKPERVRYLGLLQPLPVLSAAWEMVSMDFVEGFPKSGRFDGVMVVVDKFSRYAHFIALSHPYSAPTIARLFLDHVFKLHGMPLPIVSDRDHVFTSTFWCELFRLTSTILHLSSSYHPQTDGQTERVNQSLEAFLRCFAQACPQCWAQ